MPVRHIHSCRRLAPLALLLVVTSSCGTEEPYDWKNRRIGWTYAPTNGTALPEHMSAAGAYKGSAALAKGWRFQLTDGKKLSLGPYQIADSHPQFGKVAMTIGLFDKTGKELASLQTAVVTREQAEFSFDLAEEVAEPLHDVVIWFSEP